MMNTGVLKTVLAAYAAAAKGDITLVWVPGDSQHRDEERAAELQVYSPDTLHEMTIRTTYKHLLEAIEAPTKQGDTEPRRFRVRMRGGRLVVQSVSQF